MNVDFIYNELIHNINLIFNALEKQQVFNDYDYFNKKENKTILSDEQNIKYFYKNILDEKIINIYNIYFDFFIILYKHIYRGYNIINMINYYGYNHIYNIIEDEIKNNNKKDYNILIKAIGLIYNKYRFDTLNDFINNNYDELEIYIYSFYKENKRNLELSLDENNKYNIDLRELEINNINYKFNLLNKSNYINIYNFHLFLENKNLIGTTLNAIEDHRIQIEQKLLSLLIEVEQNTDNNKSLSLINSFLNNQNLTLSTNVEKLLLLNPYYQIVNNKLNKKYDNYWFDIIIYKNIKMSFNNFYICLITHNKNKIIHSIELIDGLYKYYALKELENNKKIYNLMKNNFIYLFLGRHINKDELLEFLNFNVDNNKWITINENHKKYLEKINNKFLDKLYYNLDNNNLNIIYLEQKENIKNCIHEYIINDIIKYNKKNLQKLIYNIIDSEFNCMCCGASLSSFILNIKDNLSNSSLFNISTIVDTLNVDEKYTQYKTLINYYLNYILRLIRIYNITEISSNNYLLDVNNKFIIKIFLDFFIFIKNKENDIRKNIKLSANSEFFIFILDKNIVSNTMTLFLERIDKFIYKKQNNIFIVLSLILICYYKNTINKNLYDQLIKRSYDKTFNKININSYLVNNIKYLTNISFSALLYGGFWNFEQSLKNKPFIEKLNNFDYINNTILDYINIITYYKKEKEVKILYQLLLNKLNIKDEIYIIDRNYTNFLKSYSKNKFINNNRAILMNIYNITLNNMIQPNIFNNYDLYKYNNLFFDLNYNPHELDIDRLKINNTLSCKVCGLIFNKNFIYKSFKFNRLNLKYMFKNDYNYNKSIVKNSDYNDIVLSLDDFNEMIDKFFNEKSFLLYYNIKILGRSISKIILNNDNIELITKTSSIVIKKSNKFRNIVYLIDQNFINNSTISVEYELNNIGKLYFNNRYNNIDFFNLIKNIILKSITDDFIVSGYRKIIKNLYNYIINFELEHIINNINFNSFGYNIVYNNLNDDLNLFKNSILMNDVVSFNIILTYFFIIIKKYLYNFSNLLYIKLINNINVNIINYISLNTKTNYYKLFFGLFD